MSLYLYFYIFGIPCTFCEIFFSCFDNVALIFGDKPQEGRHVGWIDPNCDPAAVVRDAYENARFLCDQYYLSSPELDLKTQNALDKSQSIQICYVPSHLYHMLFEIFKNAMRAVMEHHENSSEDLPPVKVVLVHGKEDICVKVKKTEL